MHLEQTNVRKRVETSINYIIPQILIKNPSTEKKTTCHYSKNSNKRPRIRFKHAIKTKESRDVYSKSSKSGMSFFVFSLNDAFFMLNGALLSRERTYAEVLWIYCLTVPFVMNAWLRNEYQSLVSLCIYLDFIASSRFLFFFAARICL